MIRIVIFGTFAACLAVAALSCADPNPAAPSPTELQYQAIVPGPGSVIRDVPVSVNSQVRAVLTWTDGGKDLDLFWTTPLCVAAPNSAFFQGQGCQTVAQSTAFMGTTEEITSSAAGGTTIRFIVLNYATGNPEATTLRVTIQPD